jgi:predicted short-subunit dehydrogenase-like oxidoreductase (DUF2520 family)
VTPAAGGVPPPGPVFILGAGTVGRALGRALREAGVAVNGVFRRVRADAEAAGRFVGAPAFWGAPPAVAAEAAVVLCPVADGAIAAAASAAAVAGCWRDGQVALHCSGPLAAVVLRPAVPAGVAVGSLHPLQTFPSAELGAGLVRGSAFALEGDAPARLAGAALVAAVGGWSFPLAAEAKALYHAAAATASNHLVALADDATALAVRAGVPAADALRALLPLMRGVLDALATRGLPDALTGPVARGDAAVVRAHLDAVAAAAPERLALYRAAARRALAVARARPGGAPAAALDTVASLLEGDDR